MHLDHLEGCSVIGKRASLPDVVMAVNIMQGKSLDKTLILQQLAWGYIL